MPHSEALRRSKCRTYLGLEDIDHEIPKRELEATTGPIKVDLDGDRGVGCGRRRRCHGYGLSAAIRARAWVSGQAPSRMFD